MQISHSAKYFNYDLWNVEKYFRSRKFTFHQDYHGQIWIYKYFKEKFDAQCTEVGVRTELLLSVRQWSQALCAYCPIMANQKYPAHILDSPTKYAFKPHRTFMEYLIATREEL